MLELQSQTTHADRLETEPHPENYVFDVEKTYFYHLKGGVRDTRFFPKQAVALGVLAGNSAGGRR